jgi:hypothetical protein
MPLGIAKQPDETVEPYRDTGKNNILMCERDGEKWITI